MSSEIDIYVSYARPDHEFVEVLHERLSENLSLLADGYLAIFLDQTAISPGTDFKKELQRALAEARAMLAVVSPSYFRSEWAKGEFSKFAQSGRPIFPVVWEEPDKDEVRKLLLRDQKYFVAPKLSSWRERDEHYLRFIYDLAHTIVQTLQPGPSPAVPPSALRPAQTREPWESEIRADDRLERASTHQPAKGYVFLSYAEEDADFLDKLRAFFGERGYAYWEFESSDRDYQKRIDLELEGIISNAVATISVISEAWKASTWSMLELSYSREIGKPVFLLKAKQVSPTLAIAGFPFIDFTKDSQQAFSRLARELTRAGL
jgi:TIR domain